MASRKYFESKYCESTLYKYVWDGAQIIHGRKFIFLSTYITKERCWNTVMKTWQKMKEKQSKHNIKWKM